MKTHNLCITFKFIQSIFEILNFHKRKHMSLLLFSSEFRTTNRAAFLLK